MVWDLSDPVTIYLLVVGMMGPSCLLLLRHWLRRQEAQRKEHVDQLRRFSTQRPRGLEGEGELTRGRALESVETRFSLIRRITVPLVLLIWLLLLAAPFLGDLPATIVSFGIASLTVVLGIAAKPVLENVIAGVMVSFSQPVRIGDLVSIGGNYGIIEEIYLTHTIVKVWDWSRFVIPNHRLIQMEYINYSLLDRWLWARLPFWVAHDSDMALVRRLAIEAVEQSPARAAGTDVGFWVMEMQREGVVVWVAGWVDHPLDAWTLKNDAATHLLQSFRAHGIRAHVFHQDGPRLAAEPARQAPEPSPLTGPFVGTGSALG